MPLAAGAVVGWHRLARGLAAGHVVFAVVTLAACTALGLDVRWRNAAPPLIVAGVMAVLATIAARRTSASPLRWMVPEGLLAFAFIVVLCIVSLPAQYAGAALARPAIDAWLAAADALMGVHVPSIAAWTRAHPTLAHALTLAYDTFALQILLAAPVLVLIGHRLHLWECIWHLHVCLVVTLLCFALWPAACAFTWYGFESTLPQQMFTAHFDGFRSGALRVVDFRNVTGLVSAPSFHVAGALVLTWATRSRLWVFVPLVLLNATLCVATVLSGAHYLVDTLLSVLLVAASLIAWRRWGAPNVDC
ncbi:MAG: phosphatase PAP2 family protein [Acidobacteria bacterium]|nr:phosphatase PAP2 family protein [Acidobacteriota bacterium]